LKPRLAADESYVARFRHEAQAVASLVHPHIVQIYEIGRAEGCHFIAQEYVSGPDLKQALHRNGPLPWPVAARILRQVGQALARAAEQGIVHRDIKPENILLTRDGEAKVADFGLARLILPDADVQMTQIGMTMGTPLYMSPEQIEGRPLDVRSDLYSLGVTVYHLLAGEPPFQGETALQLAMQHLRHPPTPLKESAPDVPPALAAVVEKMLAKDPAERFATAQEMLRTLRNVPIPEASAEFDWDFAPVETLDDLPLGVTRENALQATQQLQQVLADPPRKRSGWGIWFWAVGVGGTLLAFGLGAALASRTRPPDLIDLRPVEKRNVPLRDTVDQQYLYAVGVNSEQEYLAVPKYFPPSADPQNKAYANKAMWRLAVLYLEQGQDAKAKEIFDGLVALGSTEEPYYSIGIAGQGIVAYRAGDRATAVDRILLLKPEQRRELPDEIIDYAVDIIPDELSAF
jgi:serine/threonine-protein kinase